MRVSYGNLLSETDKAMSTSCSRNVGPDGVKNRHGHHAGTRYRGGGAPLQRRRSEPYSDTDIMRVLEEGVEKHRFNVNAVSNIVNKIGGCVRLGSSSPKGCRLGHRDIKSCAQPAWKFLYRNRGERVYRTTTEKSASGSKCGCFRRMLSRHCVIIHRRET